ncbi:MAG: hypothetical protein RLZZ306_2761 [Bacteroidota bacterium]|jgi:hypothetical protein
MKILLQAFYLITFGLSVSTTQAQIRTKHSTYLELSGGFPLILNGNQSFEYWKKGERVYGIGMCFTNVKSNYHRIQLGYREEKVLDSPAFYTNVKVKYLYESMVLKGKYHRSFLGFLYGAGIGFESLKNSPNINLTTDKTYPLLSLGLNFEKIIATPVALFIRMDADFTTSPISQPIKANVQMGLKFRISNGQ